MTDENILRRFLIRKFTATIVLVGIAEYFLLAFINNIMMPIATVALFPELENVRMLSIGNVLFIAVLLLMYFLSVLLNYLSPASGGFMMSAIGSALNYYGIGNTEGELANLSAKSAFALILTIIAVLILVVIPFAAGAVIFSGQVTRELAKFETKRNEERLENEKKRYLMISDIAHDLKTPMTTVSGYARALSDGVVKEDQQQEYLDAITNKTERMNDIIQMLFNYVRLDSEGFELVRKDIDICELVRECVSTVYQDIEDAGDELDIDVPEEKIMISADKIQLSRVLNNILTNAVKHNVKGTKISIALRREPDELRIFIADDGKAIDPELAESIFDPFVMGDKSRGTGGGSGLGLSVAKKIADMHGFKLKLVQKPEIARYKLGEEYNKVFVLIIVV